MSGQRCRIMVVGAVGARTLIFLSATARALKMPCDVKAFESQVRFALCVPQRTLHTPELTLHAPEFTLRTP
eukprot:5806186-Pyramimonas_sp.AAC.1